MPVRAPEHAPRAARPPRWLRLVLLALLLLAVLLAGAAVQLLWNHVIVPSLQAHPLGYGQALGLLLLCRILFGGWSRPQRWTPRGPGHRMQQKWASMSPAHRAQFRSHWKAGCADPAADKQPAQRPGAGS